MLLQAVALAGTALAGSFLPWAASAILLGVGTAMVYPTLLAAISDVAHPSWRATAVGVYRLWRDTGFAVGALLAGLVADLAGLEAAVWVVAALTAASGVVVAVRMYETHPAAARRMTADRMAAPLRFATFLAPNMLPVYRFLADQIAHRLGRPVQLVVGRSFDQFEHGEADLGVICGLPYVWLADRRPPPVEPLAAPVLAGDRYAGRPIYYSDVIVRHDSPIIRLEELRGCSWAYNEPASHSGHTITLYSLVRTRSSARVPGPGGRGRVPPAGHPPGRDRRRGRGRDRLPGPGHRAPRPPPAGRPPPHHRHLRALHHPTRCGRQPPPRAAEGWGPGAAGWTGRRRVGPAGA